MVGMALFRQKREAYLLEPIGLQLSSEALKLLLDGRVVLALLGVPAFLLERVYSGRNERLKASGLTPILDYLRCLCAECGVRISLPGSRSRTTSNIERSSGVLSLSSP